MNNKIKQFYEYQKKLIHDYEEKKRLSKEDQFAEIKGIYGARQHLCNT